MLFYNFCINKLEFGTFRCKGNEISVGYTWRRNNILTFCLKIGVKASLPEPYKIF